LSFNGVHEALHLKEKIKGVYAPGDFEMLAIRAYTSPALRAMQTLAIIRTEATVVNVSNAINESYMGWRDLAREMKMLKDYFPLFIVVTHQPVVALLACGLVDGDFNNPMFDHKKIRHCCGYLIDGKEVERFE
jgi:phosphohistidine phosphatase SixA